MKKQTCPITRCKYNHTVLVIPPYFANVSIIRLTRAKSFLASLDILTHSLMFELFSLLYTPSAMIRAISLSTPSSLSNTFTTISTVRSVIGYEVTSAFVLNLSRIEESKTGSIANLDMFLSSRDLSHASILYYCNRIEHENI